MQGSDVTIGEWLEQSTRRHPDKPCFIDLDRTTWTFEAVNVRVNRLVAGLRDLGVGRGDRIAILARDSTPYVETILAAMKLGAAFTPLNYRLAPGDVERLLERSGPTVLFTEDRYLDQARDAAGRVATVRSVCSYDTDYEELLSSGSEDEPPVVASDDDILGLPFTSGTTGVPKGVLQSQRMIKHMIWSCLVDYRVRSDDVRYAAAPLFHVSGMAMVLMGVAIGSTSVIAPQFDPAAVAGLLADDRLTACFMVPTMLSSVLDEPGVTDRRHERLDLLLYGASPMSPFLLRRAMEVFDCDFLNAFGAGTEAGLQCVLTPEDHRRAAVERPALLNSIGRPATGVSLRIVDEDGAEVPAGTVGEIATRSATVMDGYLDMPEATAAALHDNWFRAGDLAHVDDEGYLFLAGRRDDMIIRGGENIHPIEIENVLLEHPAVQEVAVVGVPDEHWGETVRAVIVARPDEEPSPEALTDFCRRHLPSFKVPTDIRLVPELPKNASGKVLRRDLRPSLRRPITTGDTS